MDATINQYHLEDIQDSIFEGDCLTILDRFPDNCVDMVLCDLPYGTTENKWDSVLDLEKLWLIYNRIVKPNGAILLFSQGIFTARLIMSNPSMFKYKIVWMKSKATNFLNARKQPLRKHEDICVFYQKQPTYNPQMTEGCSYNKGIRKSQPCGSYGYFDPARNSSDGGRFPTDMVYFKTAESEGKVYHSTQKPIELARYLIRTYTNPGEFVLDNTCGSGSILVAAAMENRNFCGIELNKNTDLFKTKKIDCISVIQERLSGICKPKLYRSDSDKIQDKPIY